MKIVNLTNGEEQTSLLLVDAQELVKTNSSWSIIPDEEVVEVTVKGVQDEVIATIIKSVKLSKSATDDIISLYPEFDLSLLEKNGD